MRRSLVTQITMASMALLSLDGFGANPSEEGDLKEAIVLRCHYDMGEFGVEAVRTCIATEHAALAAVLAYPEKAKAIVLRCTQNAQMDGWARAQVCIEEDMKADDALAKHPAEHSVAIEACRAEVGTRGPKQVKACVDDQISAETARENREVAK